MLPFLQSPSKNKSKHGIMERLRSDLVPSSAKLKPGFSPRGGNEQQEDGYLARTGKAGVQPSGILRSDMRRLIPGQPMPHVLLNTVQVRGARRDRASRLHIDKPS